MCANRLILQAARWSGAMACARWLTRRHIRILTYHGVDLQRDPFLNFDGLQVEPRRFEAQLAELARGYRVVPLREVVQALLGGRDPGHRTAAITFDDGYRNNLEVAAPILRRMGLPATFFITTGFMDGVAQPWWYLFRALLRDAPGPAISDPLDPGRTHRLTSPVERVAAIRDIEPRLVRLNQAAREKALARIAESCGPMPQEAAYPIMSPDQVRSLKALGFDIGNHTRLHRSLRHEDASMVHEDLQAAHERLHALGLDPVPVVAYPYGLYPTDMRAFIPCLHSVGLVAGCTTRFGLNDANTPIYELRRLDITGARDPFNMRALLSGFTVWVQSIRGRGVED